MFASRDPLLARVPPVGTDFLDAGMGPRAMRAQSGLLAAPLRFPTYITHNGKGNSRDQDGPDAQRYRPDNL